MKEEMFLLSLSQTKPSSSLSYRPYTIKSLTHGISSMSCLA